MSSFFYFSQNCNYSFFNFKSIQFNNFVKKRKFIILLQYRSYIFVSNLHFVIMFHLHVYSTFMVYLGTNSRQAAMRQKNETLADATNSNKVASVGGLLITYKLITYKLITYKLITYKLITNKKTFGS